MNRLSIDTVSTRYWRILAAFLAAFATLGLAACGASSSHSSQHRDAHSATTTTTASTPVGAPPANVTSSQQIAAYPAGSPARVLLEFWQAIQFSDVLSARRMVSPKTLTSVTPGRFTAMVQTIGDDIPGLKVVNSTKVGADASVRVFLLFYSGTRSVSASSPQSFQLHDGRSGYQMTDLSYFLRVERTILAARQKH